jgi:ribosomal protein S18 acetylase RimI-like enzyme
MDYVIKRCAQRDLNMLRAVAKQTFRGAFAHMNTPENMEAYMKKAFSVERLCSELSDAGASFYILELDGQPAGYLKLNEASAQTDIHDTQSLEIERIYLKQAFQNRGLGSVLIKKAVETAEVRNKAYIWLGVWAENHRAIQFYERNGFVKTGTHPYIIGDEEQTDYIMRRDL